MRVAPQRWTLSGIGGRRRRLARGVATTLLALGCSDDGGPDSLSVARMDAAVGDAAVLDAGPPFVRPDDPQYPQTEGLVELPFGGPAASYRFAIEAELGALDVHMSIDTSSSIDDEIRNLQSQLNGVVVAGITERVPDVAFGVSRFEDFPLAPFGSDGNDSIFPTSRPDSPFLLLTPITTSRDRLGAAIRALDEPLGFGGDSPESGAEALYQVATGEGYRHDGETVIQPFDPRRTRAAGEIGGVGFRERSLRVVLHVTDAHMHHPDDYGQAFPGTHSRADATAALEAIGARVIGIVSAPTECGFDVCTGAGRPDVEAVALGTGAVIPAVDGECATGIDGRPRPAVGAVCPLVFDVRGDGRGLSETLVDAVVDLIDHLNFQEIQASVGADPLGFVSTVRALPDPDAEDPPVLADRFPPDAPDGIDDTFVAASRRTPVEFEVELRNEVIAPGPVEQRFRVLIQVTGDGLLLQEHGIAVIVPPGEAPLPMDQDAGID